MSINSEFGEPDNKLERKLKMTFLLQNTSFSIKRQLLDRIPKDGK